jgi:hypothetical protein
VAIYQKITPLKTLVDQGSKDRKEGYLVRNFANDDYHHLLIVKCK